MDELKTTKIKANNKGERDILITALVNSGYTVRLVDVKTDGKREKVVEYWENEK